MRTAPCCAARRLRVALVGVHDEQRRSGQRGDEPLADHVDLLDGRADLGRPLGALPEPAASRSPRATSGGSRTSCGGPSTPTAATAAGPRRSSPQGYSRAERRLPSATSCAASSATDVGVKLLDELEHRQHLLGVRLPAFRQQLAERARGAERALRLQRGGRVPWSNKITHENAMRALLVRSLHDARPRRTARRARCAPKLPTSTW